EGPAEAGRTMAGPMPMPMQSTPMPLMAPPPPPLPLGAPQPITAHATRSVPLARAMALPPPSARSPARPGGATPPPAMYHSPAPRAPNAEVAKEVAPDATAYLASLAQLTRELDAQAN